MKNWLVSKYANENLSCHFEHRCDLNLFAAFDLSRTLIMNIFSTKGTNKKLNCFKMQTKIYRLWSFWSNLFEIGGG